MRLVFVTMLACLVVLAGCQTKGEKKAPCPPISGYLPEVDLCGPAIPVNDAFGSVLKG
jgi:nitrous oxide reductase accessory protein NosL